MTLRLLVILTLSTLACKQKGKVAESDLACKIKSDKKVYSTGEIMHIDVEIQNNSENTITLVKLLDGSGERMRYPYGFFEIKRNDKEYDLYEDLLRCGNMDGIQLKDFVEIRPTESFDPYAGQPGIYFITPRIFTKAGRYSLKFYYSTKETDIKKWVGDQTRFYYGHTGKPRSNKRNKLDSLLNIFREVSNIELSSNELIIDVQ